ncbi:hypothetical protein CHCC14820_0437 [Bacillus paralicheniformis]|nr:hypothetical protein CHCC14820_0437 [Bacillus paralicheniformis]
MNIVPVQAAMITRKIQKKACRRDLPAGFFFFTAFPKSSVKHVRSL